MQPLIQLSNFDALREAYPGEEEIWAVDLNSQCCFRIRADQPPLSTPISSSRFGESDSPDSLQTPLGPHRVSQIIGRGAPIGQAFKSRVPSGSPLRHFTHGEGDAILTRILWLEGLAPSLNGHSHARYIYIHGTHQEEKLGQPASQGCIRMGNQILADWTDALGDTLPLVWIGRFLTPH